MCLFQDLREYINHEGNANVFCLARGLYLPWSAMRFLTANIPVLYSSSHSGDSEKNLTKIYHLI